MTFVDEYPLLSRPSIVLAPLSQDRPFDERPSRSLLAKVCGCVPTRATWVCVRVRAWSLSRWRRHGNRCRTSTPAVNYIMWSRVITFPWCTLLAFSCHGNDATESVQKLSIQASHMLQFPIVFHSSIELFSSSSCCYSFLLSSFPTAPSFFLTVAYSLVLISPHPISQLRLPTRVWIWLDNGSTMP